MVDVEADGPIPGDYSMICFGAVVVRDGLEQTFYGRLKPISERWIPEALAVSGFSREATLGFDDPKEVMESFARWLHLGSLYKGMVKDTTRNFKHLRQTAHTHHPVDDARGNAEALLAMKTMGLNISL
jgi:hypothetical protein